ncbi:hypothetical protein [Streptomyces sp. NPDC048527]|uniref:hypothetical protein n=1 Tax=Streptomyces sp. NPDC048527 TaxID=3365568 RepID=UPI003722E25B
MPITITSTVLGIVVFFPSPAIATVSSSGRRATCSVSDGPSRPTTLLWLAALAPPW